VNTRRSGSFADDVSFVIVIPALASHLEVLFVSIPKLRALYGTIPVVITPSPRTLARLTGDGIEVLPDRAYASLTKEMVRDRLPNAKKGLAGWYYQQLLKYDIVLATGADRVLVLDADTVLLSHVPFPRGSDAPLPSSSEYHAPYFASFEALTGVRPSLTRSAIVNFMWFDRRILRDLTDHIQSRAGVDWRQAILESREADSCGFSEYETYANWSARQTRVIQKPFRLFRRGDLLVRPSRGVEFVTRMAARRRYDAIAFEQDHRSGVARRMFANLMFSLRLSRPLSRYV
jgi:Family of unknown function (DUF6492)